MQTITKVSAILSVVIGVFALLPQNQDGYRQVQILMTILTIFSASLCILACASLMEHKDVKLFPTSGILLAILGAILIIEGIWQNTGWMEPFYFRITSSTIIYAIATAHLSVLSRAQLPSKYKWVLWLAYLSVYSLASLLILIIFAEKFPATIAWQILGVIAIVAGSASALVLILQRFSKAAENAANH